MKLPDNYDPKPEAKQWYRHVNDGQLGWIVKRDGVVKIKLDRPGPREIVKPFSKVQWQLCEETRKLTPYQIGEVAFAADRVLCRVLGKYQEAMNSWRTLEHAEQMNWIATGPVEDPTRMELYRTIREHLGRG